MVKFFLHKQTDIENAACGSGPNINYQKNNSFGVWMCLFVWTYIQTHPNTHTHNHKLVLHRWIAAATHTLTKLLKPLLTVWHQSHGFSLLCERTFALATSDAKCAALRRRLTSLSISTVNVVDWRNKTFLVAIRLPTSPFYSLLYDPLLRFPSPAVNSKDPNSDQHQHCVVKQLTVYWKWWQQMFATFGVRTHITHTHTQHCQLQK